MLDFLGNLLGALLGTFAAFYLGTHSEKISRKRQQLEKIKKLKNDIKRNIKIMNETTLISSYYFENIDKVKRLFTDLQSKFNSTELINSSLEDELILIDTPIDSKLLTAEQQAWFDFRTQYMSIFSSAYNIYINSAQSTNAAELGAKLNAAKTNLDKKMTAYSNALKFIDKIH